MTATYQTAVIQQIELADERIPVEVVHALEVVEEELLEDIFDFDTVTTFVHLFGFDEESSWLESHRALYFEALRLRCAHACRAEA